MLHRPILTVKDEIEAVESLYNQVEDMLSDCPPEIAIELFKLEDRIDKLIDRIERNIEVPSHLN